MKLYTSVLPILSVVFRVAGMPNDMDIIRQANDGIGAFSVAPPLFAPILHH